MFTVVGEALVDLVEAKDPPHTYTAHAGGSPYNVAITLARLGQPVSLIARSGRDAFGRLLEQKARASGVGFERWETVDEPTTLAVASLDASGSASYDFYLDGTAGLGWDESVTDELPAGGVFHLGSLASWREPSARVMQAFQQRIYHAGDTMISYDPNVRPALITDHDATLAVIESCVAAAHLVKVSGDDLAYLYPDVPHDRVASAWCDLGATLVTLTLAGDGAVVFGRDGELAREPGQKITIADTVGAGDSFAGALLAGLAIRGVDSPQSLKMAEHDPLTAALTEAVMASAITCERPGANPPTRAELDARLG